MWHEINFCDSFISFFNPQVSPLVKLFIQTFPFTCKFRILLVPVIQNDCLFHSEIKKRAESDSKDEDKVEYQCGKESTSDKSVHNASSGAIVRVALITMFCISACVIRYCNATSCTLQNLKQSFTISQVSSQKMEKFLTPSIKLLQKFGLCHTVSVDYCSVIRAS